MVGIFAGTSVFGWFFLFFENQLLDIIGTAIQTFGLVVLFFVIFMIVSDTFAFKKIDRPLVICTLFYLLGGFLFTSVIAFLVGVYVLIIIGLAFLWMLIMMGRAFLKEVDRKAGTAIKPKPKRTRGLQKIFLQISASTNGSGHNRFRILIFYTNCQILSTSGSYFFTYKSCALIA
ncbi:MAG: hypothetical protein LIO92_07115 [Clostridiales bacterium]|nr:hypothetical protein [Clostridiales bacterium]